MCIKSGVARFVWLVISVTTVVFHFHNAEHKELPVIKVFSYEGRLSTIETKRDSGLFGNYCDSGNNSSYSFNFV